jgi:hypothetical protein
VVTISQPYSDGGDFDEAHEIGKQLVVSGCYAAELLEFGEEALDVITLLVKLAVVDRYVFRFRLGGMTTSVPACLILSHK